ncbi:hypothetical protein TNCV_2304781 [Trichonephila clavipes]|nr:hypothetical protein TNCV_2304781 [Trichonephila clavipes]
MHGNISRIATEYPLYRVGRSMAESIEAPSTDVGIMRTNAPLILYATAAQHGRSSVVPGLEQVTCQKHIQPGVRDHRHSNTEATIKGEGCSESCFNIPLKGNTRAIGDGPPHFERHSSDELTPTPLQTTTLRQREDIEPWQILYTLTTSS